MIDFNREKFPGDDEQNLMQQLQENLKMQKDCEFEIEKRRDVQDLQGATEVKNTLEVLQLEEQEIRKKLG